MYLNKFNFICAKFDGVFPLTPRFILCDLGQLARFVRHWSCARFSLALKFYRYPNIKLKHFELSTTSVYNKASMLSRFYLFYILFFFICLLLVSLVYVRAGIVVPTFIFSSILINGKSRIVRDKREREIKSDVMR